MASGVVRLLSQATWRSMPGPGSPAPMAVQVIAEVTRARSRWTRYAG